MSYNTWIHRISRQLVRPLEYSPVTPNHLTTVRLLCGLGAAICFSLDSTGANILGAILFLFSMLMDRADGELARLQGSGSRFGAFYDLGTDAIVNAGVFIALGFAAMDGWLGDHALTVGVLAGVSISVIFCAIIMTEARFGPGSATFAATGGFDPDDTMILVPIGVAAGLGDLLLISAGFCAPIAMLIICTDLYRRRKRLGVKEEQENSRQ